MRFECLKDCYDNQRLIGYKRLFVYEFDKDTIEGLRANTLFSKFRPADYEAERFLKELESPAEPPKEQPKKKEK